MTSTTPAPPETAVAGAADTRLATGGGWASALAYLVYCEIIKLLRLPLFAVPTLLFPIMFFAMFGLPNVDQEINGVAAGPYLLVSFGAYEVMSVALFSFGASIAAERGLGWNRLLRTTPLSPLTVFAAKTIMAILFGALTLILLFAFGALAGGVRMPAARWPELVLLLVAGPNSAAVVANVIFLPLSFASGLFVPPDQLPAAMQRVAPYLPSYHTGQLGWTLLGGGDGKSFAVHGLWLAGYTLLFLALAVIAYRRDEGKNYG